LGCSQALNNNRRCHKLEGSEKEFAAQLSQLLLPQQQKELILESIETQSEVVQITHLDAQQQQKLVLENLKKSEVEFISQLSELESDAQQQKDTLENIEHLSDLNHLLADGCSTTTGACTWEP